MRIFSLLILLVVASALQSQVVVNENVKHSKYAFPLVASKIKATVCYDANDYPVVKKVAELFVSDIENVTELMERSYHIPVKYSSEVYVITIVTILALWLKEGCIESPEGTAITLLEAVIIKAK